MKVTVTMTKGEKNRILDRVLFDPCEHIECENIDCEQCPLHKVVSKVRKALNQFNDAINAIPEEEDE
jgi:hypothetical protein